MCTYLSATLPALNKGTRLDIEILLKYAISYLSVCLYVFLTAIHLVVTYPISTKFARRTRGYTMEGVATSFVPLPKVVFLLGRSSCLGVYRDMIGNRCVFPNLLLITKAITTVMITASY